MVARDVVRLPQVRASLRDLNPNAPDAVLDNAHLMRLAGRFARRVRAWAADNAVPVIDCTAGERKHLVAEEYLRTHSVGPGVFMILVAKAAEASQPTVVARLEAPASSLFSVDDRATRSTTARMLRSYARRGCGPRSRTHLETGRVPAATDPASPSRSGAVMEVTTPLWSEPVVGDRRSNAAGLRARARARG